MIFVIIVDRKELALDRWERGTLLTDIDKILLQVKNGEKEKYEEIVRYFQQPLYRYLMQLLRDSEEAKDVLQDTFISAFTGLHSYRFDGRFSPWIYRIAHNAAINILKKKKRLKTVELIEGAIMDDKIALSTLSQDEDKYSILHECISLLSPKEQSLLYLRIWEEQNYDDISMILASSPVALRKRFERIKRKIGKYYIQKGGVDYNDN